MLQIPQLLNTPEFLDAPLDYKWNKKITDYIFINSEEENEKLEQAFDLLNHKAKLGFAVAISEWIYWQLYKNKKDELIHSAIESVWAGLIDKRYIVTDDYFFRDDDDAILKNKIDGPLWRVSFYLSVLTRDYIRGKYTICIDLIPLTVLARHVTNDKNLFDKWITNCLLRLSQDFPARYNRLEVKNKNAIEYRKGVYDSSDEPTIPREFFFESDFIYEPEKVNILINDYLSKLDYENNMFLNAPDVMIENGFEGTPYIYEKK